MKIINKELLDGICTDAKQNVRLRMNYNLHASLDEPVQRMLNALEPGTVLPVHRHPHTDETYLIMRGSLILKFYNNDGELLESIEMSAAKGNYGVSVAAGEWHTIEVLESDTVIFELKEGPYRPFSPDDVLEVSL
jgi:cupin fold WbuC family metalloprotein